MRGQHAHFSLRVFSHEIMIIGKLQLVLLELSPGLVHFNFPLFLLLRQDLIDVVRVLLVLRPGLIVLLLCLLEDLIEFERLLVEQIVHRLLQVLLLRLLGDLLLTPVFLL